MPDRPRSFSMPPIGKDNADWAQPGSWSGRKPADAQEDRRTSKATFAALDLPTGRPSRTLEALDLAVPHTAPATASRQGAKPHGMPSFKSAESVLNGASAHTIDSHLLAGALGGGKKLEAEISKRMNQNSDMTAAGFKAFEGQFKAFQEMHGGGSSHGGSGTHAKSMSMDAMFEKAAHTAHGVNRQAMQNINAKLSAMQPHKKKQQ